MIISIILSVLAGGAIVLVLWSLRDSIRLGLWRFEQLQSIAHLNEVHASEQGYFDLREGQVTWVTVHPDGTETW